MASMKVLVREKIMSEKKIKFDGSNQSFNESPDMKAFREVCEAASGMLKNLSELIEYWPIIARNFEPTTIAGSIKSSGRIAHECMNLPGELFSRLGVADDFEETDSWNKALEVAREHFPLKEEEVSKS